MRQWYIRSVGALALLLCAMAQAATPVSWQKAWNHELFEQAAREHRFVLLDLHAVWCHWCHVMDETTYVDPEVQRLLGKHFIAVSIDADSDPGLTSRYGDWGWPATIVLAADGTEIVKRRGYLPPPQMASLLQAIVEDPTPGPSVTPAAQLGQIGETRLAANLRTTLLHTYDELYDDDNGGWGTVHKFMDAPSLELAYAQSDVIRTDAIAINRKANGVRRARQTLDRNRALIDPVWGGVYQYSDAADWRSPHFEKLVSFQADNLRLYAEAYARWQDPKYLAAAQAMYDYIATYLSAPDGGFYVSQDADVSQQITGKQFYAGDDVARRKLGMPRIDTHRYSRETGWVIRALSKFYDVTGNEQALQSAQRSARWALQNRALAGGGFRHDAQDRGGPFLDDSIAMSQAFVALYRSTGERNWLRHASQALDFIDAHLRHKEAGYIAAPADANARGVLIEAVRRPDQNAALARVANLVHRYTGDERYRTVAIHGMKYLVAYAAAEKEQLLPDTLLADQEISMAPIHITIVGSKRDPAARALHAAGLRYPADYLQVEWSDPAEGPLPNPEISYPVLKYAAAFACTDGACSTPVREPDGVAAAVRNALSAQ